MTDMAKRFSMIFCAHGGGGRGGGKEERKGTKRGDEYEKKGNERKVSLLAQRKKWQRQKLPTLGNVSDQ